MMEQRPASLVPRQTSDGLARRPIHHIAELETRLGTQVIGHDTALYWRLFKTLGLAPAQGYGALLNSLKGKNDA